MSPTHSGDTSFPRLLDLSAPRPTILQRLRTETKAHHETLENVLSLMRPELSLRAYGEVVAQFYGFYAPLETHLLQSHFETPGLSLVTRQKSHLLRQDLTALGYSTAQVEALPTLSRAVNINSAEDVFGIAYVLEGATLGGQILLRHFQARFGITAEQGCAFFSGYGPRTSSMWKAFQQSLLQFSANATESYIDDRIVLAAKATFDSFTTWVTA